jgi:hypothetical protein
MGVDTKRFCQMVVFLVGRQMANGLLSPEERFPTSKAGKISRFILSDLMEVG